MMSFPASASILSFVPLTLPPSVPPSLRPLVPLSLLPIYPYALPSLNPAAFSPVTYTPPSVRLPLFFCIFLLGGLECVGHSFAYVAHFVFLRYVCIRTDSHPESSLSKQARYQLSHLSPYLNIICFASSVLFPFPLRIISHLHNRFYLLTSL
jgi:hypothetical protein